MMKRRRLILIILSVLILLGCIGITGYLLFSNYQNVHLFKQAQDNFARGDEDSLTLAENQLLQVVRNDSDNEAAFIMLGEIAAKRKIYPEQVYYCFMAYRLNPLSSENKDKYIRSLCFARYFSRLETILAQDHSSSKKYHQLLTYAAGRNGNINKYKIRHTQDGYFTELAFLLFKDTKSTANQKLAALEKFQSRGDVFLEQELLAARTELNLAMQDPDAAEKNLLAAYKLNRYAFAPTLGRFYARHRNFGQALKIFEEHLSVYHDQSAAIQTAEIYCLLNQTDKIAKLRNDYQSDSGNRAMLCNYYFDALTALAKKDFPALKELSIPLRKNINTPLAAFIFFCADIQGDDLTAIKNSYTALLAHWNYLDLQLRADTILSEYLKNAFARDKNIQEKLIPAATILYERKPEIFTAKLILLARKRTDQINTVLLKDALSRFSSDPGLIKIAIEYYLNNDPVEAERLITRFKQKFAAKSADMLRYEMVLNLQKKDFNKVSELFRKNFSPEILPEYWTFASSTMRKNDLLFLSQNQIYAPFCRALLLLGEKKNKIACDLLENADAQNNYALLFFAAKTLAENGRNQAALKKYALFPPGSPYEVAVLMNMSELYAEMNNPAKALVLSARAYNLAPQMPETQLCHADKLFRKGDLKTIPDIVKLSISSPFRKKMELLWIAGMQQRIKECNINTQREKVRELCRQVLVIAPDNDIALEHLKKLRQMPQ